MRVELKADGYLYIYAENELESYALRKYGEEVHNPERPAIAIDLNVSVKEEKS